MLAPTIKKYLLQFYLLTNILSMTFYDIHVNHGFRFFYKLGSDLLGTSALSYKSTLLNSRRQFWITPHTCDVIHKQITNQIRTMCRNCICFGLGILCECPKVKPCERFLVLTLKHFVSMRHALLSALKN